ncbi:Biotin synthase [hydrothermal vent metagenome]|uniref:biotin synthase n=1 Tax=hydrothermal vent metagenome TaxID=652676 RepID=A0A3B1CC56_9ZZZZ
MNEVLMTVNVKDTRGLLKKLETKAIADEPLTWDEAVWVLNLGPESMFDLLAVTDKVRRYHKGMEISLCSIINAKSGRCPEDCSFCSQSVHATGDSPVYDLVSAEKIVDGAREAVSAGAHKFGIVTSGYGYTEGSAKAELDNIITAIGEMKSKTPIHRCASLGVIDEDTARKLKTAGLIEYHHNLETARSFFPSICTTHDYEEDVNCVRAAKSAGLLVCCGGILGLGESCEQRVELAFTLKELDVDSVPLNFLNPREGTKLERAKPLEAFEILKIISAYRLIMPTKDIKVAGGREVNLRDLQSLIFAAGANSAMVGGYLTTSGRKSSHDLAMIKDLGLTVKECD